MTRRGIVVGILVLLLGGLAIFASVQLLATEKVLYLEFDDPGPDPFTPPAVFTSDSPGPPQPIDPSKPISTPSEQPSLGDNPGPVGGTTKKGDCDSELLIQYLNGNPERRAVWLEKTEVLVDDFEDYLRNTTPAILSLDTRTTTLGLKDGVATEMQTILEAGTSVLVDEEGDIVVRCLSGSPLTPPRQVKYNCNTCPPDLPPPPPCNRTCYNVPSATPETTTTTSSTTSTAPAPSSTTTTRRATSTTSRAAAVKTPTTRRRAATTTTTKPPAPVTATFFSTQPTTFPPAATIPPTTEPTQTQPQTAQTIPFQTFPPAATNPPTTQPPVSTTQDCELGILCL